MRELNTNAKTLLENYTTCKLNGCFHLAEHDVTTYTDEMATTTVQRIVSASKSNE